MTQSQELSLKAASDKKLVKRFCSFPGTYLMINLITTILFIVTLILLFTGEIIAAIVGVIVSSIFIAIGNNFNSTFTRPNIAAEMARRYSGVYGDKVGYICVAKKMHEIYGENIEKSGSETYLKIADILQIVNYIFSVVTALIFLVLSWVIFLFYILSQVFSVVCSMFSSTLAEFVVEIGKIFKIPTMIAYAHFQHCIGSLGSSSAGVVTDIEKMINSEDNFDSHLKIGQYITADCLNSFALTLPAQTHWETTGSPKIDIVYNNVTITGTLICEADTYTDENSIDSVINTVKNDISEIIKRKIEKFASEHPKAEKVKVTIEIIGKQG